MSLLAPAASGKRHLLKKEVEGGDGQQQRRKMQKVVKNSGSNSAGDELNNPPVSTTIPVEAKYKLPDVPLADKYEGGEFFFVRECYVEYYSKVEALLVEEEEEYVTVTGTPGIGKSIFYAFFFDRFRMTHPDWTIVASAFDEDRESKTLTVFEPGKHPEVHHFPSKTEQRKIMLRLRVNDMEAGQPKPVVQKKILWFCDGPPKLQIGQMVVFTSSTMWLRLSEKYVQDYYLPPWTLQELQLAASVLDYPFSDDEIESRFWNFGGVVQNCFLLDPERIRHKISQLTDPIEAISCREDLQNLLVGAPNDDTHCRFLLYEPKRDGRLWDSRIVSAMAREKMAERLYTVIKGRMNQVQQLLIGTPDTDSLRGSIFEVHAHTTLQRRRTLVARSLGVPNEQGMRFKIRKSAEMDIFQNNEVTAALLNNRSYHKLKMKTSALIDGFYFPKLPVGEAPSMDEKDKRILLFQILTDPKNDPVRSSGVIYLLKKLHLLDLVKANPKPRH